jgi:quinol monooxygenase YgiN
MIVVRFKMQCKPEKTEQVMAALKNVIAPSRKTDGVINFDIGRDLSDPNAFIATEVFDDHAALERQESLAQVATVMALFETALVSEPEATIYEVSSAE